jgi:hypothetical protein
MSYKTLKNCQLVKNKKPDSFKHCQNFSSAKCISFLIKSGNKICKNYSKHRKLKLIISERPLEIA